MTMTKIKDGTLFLDYRPNTFQRAIHESPSRFKVAVCHRRFGKTTMAVNELIKRAIIEPGLYWYVAPTYKSAKMIAWQLLNHYTPSCFVQKKNETELSITLNIKAKIGNSKIELKGSETPDTLRGAGLNGCVFDEYAEQDPVVWTQVIRPALSDHLGWAWFIGTPKGSDHLERLFKKTDTDWSSWKYKASETGILPGIELVAAREEMSEDEYNQEYECDFLVHTGLVYPEFQQNIHVYNAKNMTIPDWWPEIISIDHGYRNPTAILFMRVSPEGEIYVVNEHYERQMVVKQHAEYLKAYKQTEEPTIIIDPSTAQVHGVTVQSVQQEYSDHGVATIPGNNKVQAGINRTKEYLKKDANNLVRLHVSNICRNTIREFQTYKWDERVTLYSEEKDKPLKVNDHAMDALRMALMSRPLSAVHSIEPKKGTFLHELEKIQEEKQWGSSELV